MILDGVELKQGQQRLVHEATRNGMHYLQVASNDNGEHLYQLRVTGVSGVDLQIDEMSLSRLEAGPGTDIRAVGRVSNSRGDAAQGVVLQYVLSADATPSPGDAILYSVVLPPIPGAGIQEVRHRMTLPQPLRIFRDLGRQTFQLRASLSPN